MTEVDAYEHAQATFGQDAAVWRAASDRHVVGRWIAINDAVVPRVGAFVLGVDTVILRTKRQGLLVLGEGTTWAAAFVAAEAWRKAVVR